MAEQTRKPGVGSGLGILMRAAQTPGANDGLVSYRPDASIAAKTATAGTTLAGDALSALGSAVKGTTSKGRGGGGSAPAPTNPYASQMADAQNRMNTAMPTYTDSYAERIGKMEATGPEAYVSKYQPNIDDYLNRLDNRKAFQYNMSSDPLYRQYAAMYAQQGKRAMQDTMGQAATLTGGYGSSYASTAGNQAYQQNLSQLNDRALQLAQMARQNYDQETADLRSNLSAYQTAEGQHRSNYESDRAAWYDQLNMLQQGQANEYQKHRDAMSDWQYNLADAWDKYKYWNDKWAAMQ